MQKKRSGNESEMKIETRYHGRCLVYNYPLRSKTEKVKIYPLSGWFSVGKYNYISQNLDGSFVRCPQKIRIFVNDTLASISPRQSVQEGVNPERIQGESSVSL
jgi:hypothetical protein